jgi:hypothetical protein
LSCDCWLDAPGFTARQPVLVGNYLFWFHQQKELGGFYMDREAIKRAQEHLGKLLEQQMVRVDKMKREADWLDFSKLPKIQIGVEGGDGIGPYIAEEAVKVLKALLKDEVSKGRVEFVTVNNLTIEYRAKNNAAIPADVLEEIKKYPEGRSLAQHRELQCGDEEGAGPVCQRQAGPHPQGRDRLDLLPREHGRCLRAGQPGHHGG